MIGPERSGPMAPKWLLAVVLLLPAAEASVWKESIVTANATVVIGARLRVQGKVISWHHATRRPSFCEAFQSRQPTYALLMNAGMVKNQHLNGREGVVDQADPSSPGYWVVQLRTSTGLRDGDQLSIAEPYLHVISAPRPQAAQVADS
jgi:hypothetical protein